jgi:hypothetical protein
MYNQIFRLHALLCSGELKARKYFALVTKRLVVMPVIRTDR